ncbi:hypothetical protein B0H17DRAFT_1050775 [Mycena rosella]|uniref:Uncharacterized protein n=1 Tax=Mycena rosella TaxID=1033263 RepID=A0AAD7DUG5_MYCRO|nr:hypothetical protein B0H17DRAFT_1050775 [Mycena rosella]
MADPYDPYQEELTYRPQAKQTSSTLTPNRSKFPRIPEARDRRDASISNSTTILLTGSAVVLAVLAIALGLIVQIFVKNVYHLTGRAVYTTAPLGSTLAIAHISSALTTMSVPVTIGLGAYWLAGRWLASSYDEGVDRPTPYQLGILMRTLNGANLGALWTGSNYMVGRGTVPGGKTLRRPPILRHAIFMLFTFLALAYGTAATETWLGSTSESVLYPVTAITSQPGAPAPAFGRQVNQTLCNEEKNATNNQPYQCGFVRGTSGNPQANSQRILAMNGLSNTTIVALTNDSTAIMVPAISSLSTNLGYTATTLGVKSVCTSVTSQCVDLENTGPNAGLFTNCPSSVNFNTSSNDFGCNSYGGTLFGGPLGSDGSILECLQTANATDFRYGIIVISEAYNADTSVSGEDFVGNTGFFLHGNRGGYNLLTCDVNSLVVTYHYFNGSYTTLASSASDLPQAQRVLDGSWAGSVYVPPAIEGVGLYSGNYADSFASGLSKTALAATTYVMEPTEALETEFVQTNLGSRLPLAPLLLLFTLSFLYCALVLAVTALAVREIFKSPLTSFAHSRLVDPVTVISTAYGPEDSKLKRTHEVQELFGDETVADRLNVAVHDETDGLPPVRRSKTTAARPET